MAEDDTPNQAEDEETAPIAVPLHDTLPPPPELHYTRPDTRPAAGQMMTPGTGRKSGGSPALGGWDDPAEAASHGAGLAAGTTFVVSIIAGAMLGNWIDQRWNHTGMPWATLVMTLLGAAAGFLNLKRILDRANRKPKQK